MPKPSKTDAEKLVQAKADINALKMQAEQLASAIAATTANIDAVEVEPPPPPTPDGQMVSLVASLHADGHLDVVLSRSETKGRMPIGLKQSAIGRQLKQGTQEAVGVLLKMLAEAKEW